MNSADYGTPQTRRRLFLAADRERSVQVPSLPRFSQRSARTILDAEDTYPTSPLFKPGRAQNTIDKFRKGHAALGGTRSFLVVYYGNESNNGGWQSLDLPLRTVTTRDRFGLVTHDGTEWRLRMLQVDELKRAMGFPESFQLGSASKTTKTRMLGNAVCPAVMERVVHSLTR